MTNCWRCSSGGGWAEYPKPEPEKPEPEPEKPEPEIPEHNFGLQVTVPEIIMGNSGIKPRYPNYTKNPILKKSYLKFYLVLNFSPVSPNSCSFARPTKTKTLS